MRRAVLFLFLLLTAASSPPQQQRTEQQRQSEQQIADSLERIAAAAERDNESANYTAECAEGADRRDSDLCAQWKAADAASETAGWTRWTWYLGLIGVVVGVLTLGAAVAAAYFAMRAAEHTKRTADAAERQLVPHMLPGPFQLEKKEGDMWTCMACIRVVGPLPSGIATANLAAVYQDLPIPREGPEFTAEEEHFGGISSDEPAQMWEPVILSAEQIEKIERLAGCVLIRLWVKHTPPGDADVQEMNVRVISIGTDLKEGDFRTIPSWAYKDPNHREKGQQHLNLPPPA